MKVSESGAAPQIAEPISKTRREARYTHLGLYKVYIFPMNSMKAQDMSKYAEPYHPTSPKELKSLVIAGMATPMTSRSRAVRNTTRNILARIKSIWLVPG